MFMNKIDVYITTKRDLHVGVNAIIWQKLSQSQRGIRNIITNHLAMGSVHLCLCHKSLPLLITNIQNRVIDIKSWMTTNVLQLNMDKTRGFSTDEHKHQKSHYHEQNQNWFNQYINCNQRQKSCCYIWQCFKLRSFCEIHLQICLVQFIQHQQKPKVSNNRCCQDHYPSLRDVQNRL